MNRINSPGSFSLTQGVNQSSIKEIVVLNAAGTCDILVVYIIGGMMQRKVKLFRNGRSQAVRLPAEFRFEGKEIFIRQDPETGDVVLSRRPDSWESFFDLADKAGVPEDFMSERGDAPPQKRNLF